MTGLADKSPDLSLNRLSLKEKRIVITKRTEEQGAEKNGSRLI